MKPLFPSFTLLSKYGDLRSQLRSFKMVVTNQWVTSQWPRPLQLYSLHYMWTSSIFIRFTVIKAQGRGPKKWAMCRLHYSCRTPCTRWRAFTSADERAGYDSMVLWYIADGCVIIRGIHWLSFGAAILPSGGRGASTGVDHPTAALFQVPLSWKE